MKSLPAALKKTPLPAMLEELATWDEDAFRYMLECLAAGCPVRSKQVEHLRPDHAQAMSALAFGFELRRRLEAPGSTTPTTDAEGGERG